MAKTITICSSASFYQHACQIADELEKQGYKTLLPATAKKMRASGNYNVDDYKTWYQNDDDYYKKSQLMMGHFKEIEKGDAVLIVNDEKNGELGYVGSNVLMEIALAFWLKKPIFVLNSVSRDSRSYEEIIGVGSVILDGDMSKVNL